MHILEYTKVIANAHSLKERFEMVAAILQFSLASVSL